jgi:RNA polymerase sigma factor (sigma-70 family)
VERWLERWPHPIAFLLKKCPATVRQARLFGWGDDDIDAAAKYGGVVAARLFDPRRGVKFSSFALWYARHAVQQLFRRQQIDRDNRGGSAVESLSQPVADGKGQEDDLGNLLADGRAADPTVGGGADLAAAVAAVVRTRLPARYRTIAELRWGIGGRKAHTLKEIGAIVGVTRERVRQIELAILRKCRPALERVYTEFLCD